MQFDVKLARAQTPGCAAVTHLNNAGAALMPDCVLAALRDHLNLEAQIGGYEAADEMNDAIEATYDAIASLIGCHRDEVAVVENATRAWDMAFYAIPFAPGDRILTSVAEYGSNYLAFLQVARRTGARVEAVPNDESGQLSVDALARMLDERVKLIAITHVPTNGGLVNPAAEVGRLAKAAGVPYLLDACQSVGQLPVNVDDIGCDVLSVTGRKYLRGPRGTGFLYVRQDLIEKLDPPFIDLHAATWTGPETYTVRSDARRFENWESYVAGRIGLGVAVNYALGWGLQAIAERVKNLADELRGRLAAMPGVEVRDLGQERCGIVSFTMAGQRPTAIKAALRKQRINVSMSRRSSTLLDMDRRGLDELVRASVHYYNTSEELDRLCGALAELR